MSTSASPWPREDFALPLGKVDGHQGWGWLPSKGVGTHIYLFYGQKSVQFRDRDEGYPVKSAIFQGDAAHHLGDVAFVLNWPVGYRLN